MQGQTAAWVNMLISWMPFLILIGFWVYFMKRGIMSKQAKYMERNTLLMEQQQKLLERIAMALEARDKGPR